ncbi:MAG: hypothetical protein U0441_34675 [Polyangiaceae bacterium]
MRRHLLAFAIAIAACVASVPSVAHAGKTSVTWAKIDVPDRDDAAAFQKTLKKLLDQAAKKANFGGAKSLSFTVKVTEMTSETKGDVHRVTCAIVGRIPGGPSAKSRISFGGSPADKAKLEKQVLGMVAHAVVTRLAEMSRARAAKEAAKEKAADE